MGAYSIDELLQRWGQHDLTPEQVIGQMLLLMQELRRRVEELEQRMRPEGIVTPTKRR